MTTSDWPWFQPPTPLRYWARWVYTSDEWQRLEQLDWIPARRRMLLRSLLPIVPLVLLVGLLAILVLGKLRVDALLLSLLSGLLIALLVGSLLHFFIWGLPPYRQARQRHLVRQQGPQHIILGEFPAPVLLDQHYIWQAKLPIPLLLFRSHDYPCIELKQADLLPGALPVVRLRRRLPRLTRQPRRRYRLTQQLANALARSFGWSETLYLPVPLGHEAQAAVFVRRLRQITIPDAKPPRPIPL